MSVEDFATYYNNDADAVAADSYDDYGDEYAYPGAYTFDLADWLEYLGEGDFVLIVYGCDGGVTTPAVTFEFTLSDNAATDISNVTASKETTKRIDRNGTLIIEKNGVRYNAVGAKIR